MTASTQSFSHRELVCSVKCKIQNSDRTSGCDIAQRFIIIFHVCGFFFVFLFCSTCACSHYKQRKWMWYFILPLFILLVSNPFISPALNHYAVSTLQSGCQYLYFSNTFCSSAAVPVVGVVLLLALAHTINSFFFSFLCLQGSIHQSSYEKSQ